MTLREKEENGAKCIPVGIFSTVAVSHAKSGCSVYLGGDQSFFWNRAYNFFLFFSFFSRFLLAFCMLPTYFLLHSHRDKLHSAAAAANQCSSSSLACLRPSNHVQATNHADQPTSWKKKETNANKNAHPFWWLMHMPF